MQKPEGWNEVTPVFGGGTPKLPPGGYVCKIMYAGVKHSKNGNEMLCLALDIADGEHKDFYSNIFQGRKAAAKDGEKPNWPCVYYQLTQGEATAQFKGLTINIEESNPGYHWDFDEKTLKGKLIGGVFREEEFIGQRDNKVHTTVKCAWLCPVEGVEDAEVPAKKCLDNAPAGMTGGTVSSDDDIPF